MSLASRVITADELWGMDDHAGRYELIAGELISMTPSGHEHSVVSLNVGAVLREYARRTGLGVVGGAEGGFKITSNPDTVLAPDVSFVSRARIQSAGVAKAYFPGAPDLAVEVVSPHDRVSEVDEKVERWLAHGCRSVWVVSPSSRSVVVHHADAKPLVFTKSEKLEAPDVLPGFVCLVHELFE